MKRTIAITGAGSGIGLCTKELLEATGNRVIGIDLKGAEVAADLSTESGRTAAFEELRKISEGRVDAIIANAGSAAPLANTVAINFYGAVELIKSARALLVASPFPRVVATSSMATLLPVDELLVSLLLDGKESAALTRAQEMVDLGGGAEQLIYSSSKRALSRWIRRNSVAPEWAGAGIPMNAVAPGIVKTPMVAEMISTAESRAALSKRVPMPLHGYLEPDAVAKLLIWLIGIENTHITGQTIYIDGGSDAVIRGDEIWR